MHYDPHTKTKTEVTDRKWLRVGAQIAEVANEWAARNDLVVFLGEGATEGLAPALFRPAIAEIEINTEIAFGFGVSPENLDFTKPESRYEFARATGAVIHEAMHARYSMWNIPKAYDDLKADEAAALMLFEESRIEMLGIKTDPAHRVFLRASAFDIILSDIKADNLSKLTASGAAQLVALVNGRVIGGVLDADEVADITSIIRKVLGETIFLRMLEILDEYQQHPNHYNVESMYPLAVEWAQLVRQAQEERGEQPENNGEQQQGSGSPSEGGEMSDELKELIETLQEVAEDLEISNISELADQQEKQEWDEIAKERKKSATEQKKSQDVSQEVFGKGTEDVEGNGTYSTLAEKRSPNSSERRAAVTVASLLERAKYRDRDVTVVSSREPVGKLRTRIAVQNAAQKAQGLMPTGEAWRKKVRKQTDEPTLTVGVMVDISGSMRAAMEPMAATAWVMSEAVRRVQGKTAMVYYGQDVFPTLKAGQHLDTVNVWTAADPTEKFDKAFRALDGSLNLLNGNGARLLVVVSDGVYTGAETSAARSWLRECDLNGVGVLWLGYENGGAPYAARICEGTQSVLLRGILNPETAALEIGRAAASALERISAKRAA